MKAKWIVILVLLALFGIFTLQNIEVVSIRFFFWTFSLSRVLLLFIMLLIGVLIGYFLGSHRRKQRDQHHATPPA